MAIRNKKYIVRLNQEERESVQRLVRVGKAAARKISRARILLKADAGEGGPGWTDRGCVGRQLSHRGERASLLRGGGFGACGPRLSGRRSTRAAEAGWRGRGQVGGVVL